MGAVQNCPPPLSRGAVLLSTAFHTGLQSSSALLLVTCPASQTKQPMLCSRGVTFLAVMGFVMVLLVSPALVRATKAGLPELSKITELWNGVEWKGL